MPGTVTCPICGRPVAVADPDMPFCSDRCRLIDLGNWASEKYTIPAIEGQHELEEDDRVHDELAENVFHHPRRER